MYGSGHMALKKIGLVGRQGTFSLNIQICLEMYSIKQTDIKGYIFDDITLF